MPHSMMNPVNLGSVPLGMWRVRMRISAKGRAESFDVMAAIGPCSEAEADAFEACLLSPELALKVLEEYERNHEADRWIELLRRGKACVSECSCVSLFEVLDFPVLSRPLDLLSGVQWRN